MAKRRESRVGRGIEWLRSVWIVPIAIAAIVGVPGTSDTALAQTPAQGVDSETVHVCVSERRAGCGTFGQVDVYIHCAEVLPNGDLGTAACQGLIGSHRADVQLLQSLPGGACGRRYYEVVCTLTAAQ